MTGVLGSRTLQGIVGKVVVAAVVVARVVVVMGLVVVIGDSQTNETFPHGRGEKQD